MNLTQKALACGCIVPIIMCFAVILLLGTVMTSISPTDRSLAPSSELGTGGSPFVVPSAAGSDINCPLQDARLTLGSYNSANGTGHGTESYFQDNFGGRRFSIPLSSSGGFGCSGGCCYPADCPYFGFAADFAGDGSNVYAPGVINCGSGPAENVVKWTNITSDAGITTSFGCGMILRGDTASKTGKYRLFLLHLNTCGADCTCYAGSNPTMSTFRPGGGISNLFPRNMHVHVELMVDNAYVKPENCMCK